ncbi:MAG TPA: hypothetical protein VGI46_13150 [Candidatus Acidoferrum sp.]
MASHPLTSQTANPPAVVETSAAPARVRHRMSTRNRLLFFVTAWLIVLMPFLFWWSTWFGRSLSGTQITQYLNDNTHPRHIQHALVQLGERMGHQGPSATTWYPQLLLLASHRVEEIRNTDAWVMGQDTSNPAFHETLIKMLQDSSPMVRGNAALSLVRFGDAAGRPQIVALLQPAVVVAPTAGHLIDIDKIGTYVRQGGLIAKLSDGARTTEIRTPITGRIRTVSVATGAAVAASAEIASIDPSSEQVWEALRGLYLVGQPDDLPAIRIYDRNVPEDRLREQAILAEKAIQARAAK